jgi:Domain of unknown function (DUF4276)
VDSYVTTFFDFYACPWRGSQDNVEAVEAKLQEAAVFPRRLIPYAQQHEFEALLFSSPEAVVNEFNEPKHLQALQQAGEPETINSKFETCPARRLEALFPTYQKTLHGPKLAEAIGIDTIRAKWLKTLEALAS